jgi:ParB family chromosome partitioning protein
MVEGVTNMAMPAKKKSRRLGKGLQSLLSTPVEVTSPDSNDEAPSAIKSPAVADMVSGTVGNTKNTNASDSVTPGSTMPVGGLVYLDVDLLAPNARQPRQVFDDDGLSSLAESIQKAGLMQPVIVRPSKSAGEYELVAGERRWRAAQMAGLKQIPAIIKEIDDKTSAEWALIENLQREDLNPIDRAEAFDRLVVDFNATQKEIATQLGIDRSSVANFLRLNDLEPSIKDSVRDGRLSMGHAKVLLGIPDTSTSKAIARKCAREQWSVRELESQLKKLSNRKPTKVQQEQGALEMYMLSLADQLGMHLGTKVTIGLGKKKGTGKLTLDFYSNDQFEGLLDQLRFKPKS